MESPCTKERLVVDRVLIVCYTSHPQNRFGFREYKWMVNVYSSVPNYSLS